jgi:[ribosomal protein S5]-alanine N-acetyltransferase
MDLVTRRLRLRPLAHEDLDALSAMTRDLEVMRFVGDGQPLGRTATRHWIANATAGLADMGLGSRAVTLKDTGDLIGWAGLIPSQPNIELIYGLAPAYWGQGYATEAAGAVLKTRAGRAVDATIDPKNAASRRILEKLGFQVVGMEHDEHGLPTLRLRLGG